MFHNSLHFDQLDQLFFGINTSHFLENFQLCFLEQSQTGANFFCRKASCSRNFQLCSSSFPIAHVFQFFFLKFTSKHFERIDILFQLILFYQLPLVIFEILIHTNMTYLAEKFSAFINFDGILHFLFELIQTLPLINPGSNKYGEAPNKF